MDELLIELRELQEIVDSHVKHINVRKSSKWSGSQFDKVKAGLNPPNKDYNIKEVKYLIKCYKEMLHEYSKTINVVL